MPLKHISPETHCSHLVALSSVNLYPGVHVHSLIETAPVEEVKFTGQETMRSEFPPAQYDPLVQIGHGLVPDLEPLPKYPGAQRHWFCEVENKGLRVLLGHWLLTPATHHEFSGQGEHWLPFRTYPALHTHGQSVSAEPTPLYVEYSGRLVHSAHTMSAVAEQNDTGYCPEEQTLQVTPKVTPSRQYWFRGQANLVDESGQKKP
jgi:hypothetical protein